MIERVEPLMGADEARTLDDFLEYFRATLFLKVAGLTDEQARTAACPPSPLNLMGIVRHMAEVERNWFRWVLSGDADAGAIYYTDDDPDGDMFPPPDATLAEAAGTLEHEIVEARRLRAGVPLDQMSAVPRRDGHPNLRWILVHMIEEYARHCGHADLLREAIDGTTGD
jgi:Protein of unknown function (DUF664)